MEAVGRRSELRDSELDRRPKTKYAIAYVHAGMISVSSDHPILRRTDGTDLLAVDVNDRCKLRSAPYLLAE